MMRIIHTSKKRMPLIFERSKEELWLDKNLNQNQIQQLMLPLDENLMDYHTISKRITSKTENPNDEKLFDRVEYPELNTIQKSLFDEE